MGIPTNCVVAHGLIRAVLRDAVVQDELPEDQLNDVRTRVRDLIASDVALAHFTMDKDAAMLQYDGAMLETPRRLDAGVTTLDLVYVDGVILFHATTPLLPSAAYLGEVEVTRVSGHCTRCSASNSCD